MMIYCKRNSNIHSPAWEWGFGLISRFWVSRRANQIMRYPAELIGPSLHKLALIHPLLPAHPACFDIALCPGNHTCMCNCVSSSSPKFGPSYLAKSICSHKSEPCTNLLQWHVGSIHCHSSYYNELQWRAFWDIVKLVSSVFWPNWLQFTPQECKGVFLVARISFPGFIVLRMGLCTHLNNKYLQCSKRIDSTRVPLICPGYWAAGLTSFHSISLTEILCLCIYMCRHPVSC